MFHPGIEIHFPHWLKPLKVVKYSLTNFPNSSDRNTTCVQSKSNIFKLKCQIRDQSEIYLDFEIKFQNSNEHNIPPPHFDKYKNSFMTENRNGETFKKQNKNVFLPGSAGLSLALLQPPDHLTTRQPNPTCRNSRFLLLSNPNLTSTQQLGFAWKGPYNHHHQPPTTHTKSMSAISHLLLTQFCWNFKGRFLGTPRTDSNCPSDICPCNICPGDICPYEEYLSCYWLDFD